MKWYNNGKCIHNDAQRNTIESKWLLAPRRNFGIFFGVVVRKILINCTISKILLGWKKPWSRFSQQPSAIYYITNFYSFHILKFHRSILANSTKMGKMLNIDIRNNWWMAKCATKVFILGRDICGWRYSSSITRGSEEIRRHWPEIQASKLAFIRRFHPFINWTSYYR